MSLQNAPIVMVWREVSDLAHADAIASKTLSWAEIGRNSYAVMYDAGNAIAAYWARPQFQQAVAVSGCSDSNAEASVAHNPASEFLVLTQDFNRAASLVGAASRRRTISVSGRGDTVSLVDSDGNYAAYLSPSHPIVSARDSKSLFRAVAEKASSKQNPYVAHKFLVSDLDRSVDYYRSVLGLELIERADDHAAFDCGAVSLVLQQEPASGLVRSLQRAGRLASDGLIFYADDAEKTGQQLTRAGVEFPRGIQQSLHGPGGEFFDPDGHKLGIWSRPAQPGAINYFAVLDRILDSGRWLFRPPFIFGERPVGPLTDSPAQSIEVRVCPDYRIANS